MLVWFAVLAIALYSLYKVSEIAVEELEKFAEYSGITKLALGFFFLAVSTSLPELSISIGSVFLGNSEISLGVSLGNILYDLLFVLPIVAIWYEIRIKKDDFQKILFSSLIPLLSLFPILLLKEVSRIYGFSLVLAFIIFSRYLIKERQATKKYKEEEKMRNKILLSICLLSISFFSFLINLSTKMISQYTKISTLTIGAVAISLSTSMPELFSCLHAAKRKNYSLIIGIIYGTLIFDSIFVIGSTSLLSPIQLSNFYEFTNLYSFLALSIFSIIFMLRKGRRLWISEGIFLLLLFSLFIFSTILVSLIK